MRPAEVISLTFFGLFVVAGTAVPLARSRRLRAIAIGATGIGIALLLPQLEAVPGGGIVRDFVPSFLLLIGYWQTGQFVVGRNAAFQSVLERFDRRWMPRVEGLRLRAGERSILSSYLEAAYLACYPVVPLGVAVLYLGGRGDAVDQFWCVVLPATYATHALTTVFQSWPPWMADRISQETAGSARLHALNEWVTSHASIRFNSFPSGHVASSLANAFVVTEALPVAGLVFLWIAASIAVSSVLLRYHYGLDVILGAALAVLFYAVLG